MINNNPAFDHEDSMRRSMVQDGTNASHEQRISEMNNQIEQRINTTLDSMFTRAEKAVQILAKNYQLTVDGAMLDSANLNYTCTCYVNGADEPGYIIKTVSLKELSEQRGGEGIPFWRWIQECQQSDLHMELEIIINRKENRTVNYLLSQPHLMDLGVDGLRRVA